MKVSTLESPGAMTNSEIVKGAEEFPISSRFGITCQQSSRSLELVVPTAVFEKIGAGDPLLETFKNNFSMGAAKIGDFYVIEFPTNTAVEKIQAIVNKIEDVHEAE
jgi:hypothetical protein